MHAPDGAVSYKKKQKFFGKGAVNMKNIIQSREKLILLLVQGMIMAAAVLYWLASRGNAFQKTFSLEEFQVSDSTVVVQDVTTDETMFQGGVFMQTPALALARGVYQVDIGYNANHPGSRIAITTTSPDDSRIHCRDAILNPNLHRTTLSLELTETDTIVISADFSGDGYLSITNVSISETSALYKRTLFYAFLLCLLIFAFYRFLRSARTTKAVFLALSCIFAMSSFLLFRDHLLYADDLFFHLLRIEGLQKGLHSGTFPVKIYPVMAQDYGYAVGVFYGDLALYFPALLRLLGFSVQSAYQFFVGALNLGTVIISYFSFRRMFHSRLSGISGCALCSLNHYRLLDVYQRAAVGECLGIMFFPLALLSFYLIFMETTEKNWWKHALLTAFSMTGLIQSHILSCEIVFFLVLVTCLVLIRLTLQKYRFFALLSAAALSVLLNLGFLVPLFDYYREDILITSPQWLERTAGKDLQAVGLDINQLFTLVREDAFTEAQGSSRLLPPQHGVGLVFGAGILLFLILLLCQCIGRPDKKFQPVLPRPQSSRNFFPALFCFVMGCVTLFMSTSLFPWNALSNTCPLAEKLCYSLQFPWRMLAPSSILLSFPICYSISFLRERLNMHVTTAITLVLAILLLGNCGWFFAEKSLAGRPHEIYATEDLDTMLLGTNDYFPTDTDVDAVEAGRINQSYINSYDAYDKNGTEIRCHVSAGSQDSYLEFPLNYYKYYVCTDDSGHSLPVSSGNNGMLRVSFPEGFDGNILLTFREPLHWRIAEGISLAAGLGCLLVFLLHHRKKPEANNKIFN